jgi:hypothetical protein
LPGFGEVFEHHLHSAGYALCTYIVFLLKIASLGVLLAEMLHAQIITGDGSGELVVRFVDHL